MGPALPGQDGGHPDGQVRQSLGLSPEALRASGSASPLLPIFGHAAPGPLLKSHQLLVPFL